MNNQRNAWMIDFAEYSLLIQNSMLYYEKGNMR